MVLDNKTKKILKVFCLVFLVAILTGCAQNLDANGKLIASGQLQVQLLGHLMQGGLILSL
ncbi:MAG: hypothetical protein V8R63_10260 [Thomasclavelia ramosa]